MLDVSNNNGFLVTNPSLWKKFRQSGQRRVYLKLTEGNHFRDPDEAAFTEHARAVGFLVGRYHFARPSTSSVAAELSNALGALPTQKRGRDLRFCLDVEDPRISPGRDVGRWVEDFCTQFRRAIGYAPLIYGSFFYLSACNLDRSKIGPLWLASYTRDGKWHGSTAVPRPWVKEGACAVQYSPTFHFGFMPRDTKIDISHVIERSALDIPRFRLRPLRTQ